MKRILFVAPFLLALFFVAGCKKIKKNCSEDAVITFDEYTYTCNRDGLLISYSGINAFYEGSDSYNYSYNDRELPTRIEKVFNNGNSWTTFILSWNGDSCLVKQEAEGIMEPWFFSLVINENGELLRYKDDTYYYTGAQLDSITNSTGSNKYYFFYEDDLLTKVDRYNGPDLLYSTTEYSYDKKDRLIKEVVNRPGWGQVTLTELTYKRNGYLEKINYDNPNPSLGREIKKEVEITQTGCSYPRSLDPTFNYKYGYFMNREIGFKK